MLFLEVGVVPVSASLCYFYVVVRGVGSQEGLLKPSSGLRLQCEQRGSLCGPVEIVAETFCLLSGRKGDKWGSALENVGPRTEKDLLCFLLTRWITETRDIFQTSWCCFAAFTSWLGLVEQGGDCYGYHLCRCLATGALLKGKGPWSSKVFIL